MKHVLLCIVLFSYWPASVQGLNNGDTMRDVEVKNVINYHSGELKFNDLDDKLVLLDFWGLTCMSCIEGLPGMDSLQKFFGDKIQVVLVNRDNAEKTEAFFKKRVTLIKPDAPLVTTDTTLHRLFQHVGAPFHVWIAPGGKVLYQADDYFTTKENIEKVLAGEDIALPLASVIARRVYTGTLLDSMYRNYITNYSYLAAYDPDIRLQSDSDIPPDNLLTFSAFTPEQFYQALFKGLTGGKTDFTKPGRTVYESYQPGVPPENPDEWADWMRENAYNYQLFAKSGNARDNYKKMKAELDTYFRLNASVQKRKVKRYALVQTGSLEKLRTKGDSPFDNFMEWGLEAGAEDSVRQLRNQPFSRLPQTIGSYITFKFGPFINRVNFTGNIDITFAPEAFDKMSIPLLKKELRKYNLDLLEEEVVMEVLVIKKRE